MNTVTLVPIGGLGNRIRVIESGIRLAKKFNSKLKVIWFKDYGMGCRFDRLFCPVDDDNIQVKDASFMDYIYDRPRLKNLYLPYITEKILFNHCISEKQSSFYYNKYNNYEEIAKKKNIYIASFMPFYLSQENDYYHVFKPIPELQTKIEKETNLFSNNTIGIQIRRADNSVSIELSPTDLFIEKMYSEKDALFYLATDSNEEKTKLSQLFKERILYKDNILERKSEQGIQHALIEMFILSKTRKIYGSVESSFGEVASLIGKVEYESLDKRFINGKNRHQELVFYR